MAAQEAAAAVDYVRNALAHAAAEGRNGGMRSVAGQGTQGEWTTAALVQLEWKSRKLTGEPRQARRLWH